MPSTRPRNDDDDDDNPRMQKKNKKQKLLHSPNYLFTAWFFPQSEATS